MIDPFTMKFFVETKRKKGKKTKEKRRKTYLNN